MVSTHQTIGQPVGRAEGPEKVTGAVKYPADVNPPGTLTGKCLRSPYPHARIKSIDVSAARQVPGVHAVLTGYDIPDRLVGRMLRDMPALARDVVRFVGQKVAAVAAEDAEIAELFGLSPASVTSHRWRAMRKLQECLGFSNVERI